MKQDVRYAFRSWRRTPAIPAIALTALTLGMGANISIFSVMHAVLLRSLPVPAPERLMLLRETNIARGLENGNTGEVVGVVADVRMRNLGEPPERVVYYPPAQFGFFPLFNVVVRTEGPPETAAPLIRERLKVHDPNLAAYDVQNMRHWVERSSSLMRIRTRLVTLLGTLALVLRVIGIYGVMSYLVSQRAREFAIRVALGAQPRALPLVVVAQALRFTVPGIVLGLLGALFVGSRLRGLLFEVDARDPATFATVGIAVALVAVTASYAPARRAATADPLVVLRAE
jgi:ABC-type antimicrobial peptide transport system permease subunit